MGMNAAAVQRLYVAYFNRPADTTGLARYEAMLSSTEAATQAELEAIATTYFSPSAEYTSNFAGLSEAGIVNKLYQNLFGRDAEPKGLQEWALALANGTETVASIALQLSFSAQGTDADTIANKIEAAAAFTAALDTTDEIVGYSGDAAAASAASWLATVGSSEASKDAAIAGVDAAVAAAVAASDTSTEGSTFTLTTNPDTLDPSSATASLKTTDGNDTVRAPTDGMLATADFIDTGKGNDTLTASITAADQSIAPVLKNVEDITLTVTAANEKEFTFNATDTTGASTINIKDAGAVGKTNADEAITVSNMAKTTTLGIIGGTAATGVTSSEITATFAGAAAADTQKVAISSLGRVDDLTLSTAETVEITATGNGTTGGNIINDLSAAAVKTLNLKGSGDLTISGSDTAATVTVNSTTSTGAITFVGETAATSTTFNGGSGTTSVTTASTGVVNVTTGVGADTINVGGGNSTSTIDAGDGNDTVVVGAQANVTAADSIVGGEGIDTIVITDATINLATKTALATGSSGFEALSSTATTAATVDFKALAAFNTVVLAGTIAPNAAADAAADANGTAGAAAVTVTGENDDALVLSAAKTGQVGQTAVDGDEALTSGAGGIGLSISPSIDGGSDVATLKIIGNADVTGGAGGATANAADLTAGNGGVGLSAGSIETLNIDVSGTGATGATADTVSIAGGAAGTKQANGAAGAAGSDVVVGTNATINVTSSLTGATAAVNNHLDLGTVVGTNVEIAATTFAGNLTVTAASGNVTINSGAGNDSLTGGTGSDTIGGGAGNDVITGLTGVDALTGGAGRDSFTFASETDSASATPDAIADFGKVTEAATAAQVTAMNNVAAFQAAATAKGGADADMLDMEGTAALATAATGTDVSGAVTGAGDVVTASISAKGVITLDGADAANADTLAEWVAIAAIMCDTDDEVGVFEFGGNSYVFQQETADTVIQLTGVTGVTGIVLVGGAVAAAAGDIFVI